MKAKAQEADLQVVGGAVHRVLKSEVVKNNLHRATVGHLDEPRAVGIVRVVTRVARALNHSRRTGECATASYEKEDGQT